MTFYWQKKASLAKSTDQRISSTISILHDNQDYFRVQGAIDVHSWVGTDSAGNDVTKLYAIGYEGLDAKDGSSESGFINLPVEANWTMSSLADSPTWTAGDWDCFTLTFAENKAKLCTLSVVIPADQGHDADAFREALSKAVLLQKLLLNDNAPVAGENKDNDGDSADDDSSDDDDDDDDDKTIEPPDDESMKDEIQDDDDKDGQAHCDEIDNSGRSIKQETI